jgi:hypothetical protein
MAARLELLRMEDGDADADGEGAGVGVDDADELDDPAFGPLFDFLEATTPPTAPATPHISKNKRRATMTMNVLLLSPRTVLWLRGSMTAAGGLPSGFTASGYDTSSS